MLAERPGEHDSGQWPVLVGGFAVGPSVADRRSELGLVEPVMDLGLDRDRGRDRSAFALVLAVDLGAAADLDPEADLVDSDSRE